MTRTIKLLLSLTLVFIISSCQKEVSVETGGPARGSLQNDAGDCMPKVVKGAYIANTALTDSNYIDVTLEISQPGRYTIKSDTLNGYSFAGSGNLTTAGVTTVRLKGKGTPESNGTDNFTLIFDTTFCVVSITVLPEGTVPPPPGSTTGVYFPMTENSWWSYDDGDGSDTLKTMVSGTEVLSGKTYQRFISTWEDGSMDTAFYRKDASNNYYNYLPVSDLTDPSGPLTFDQPGLDILFLKDVLKTGDVFNSDHPAQVSGFPVTVRFQNTVLNAAAVLSVNGKSFSDVYQIKVTILIGTAGVFNPVPGGSELIFYFAKDIGLIRITDDSGGEQAIRNWRIL